MKIKLICLSVFLCINTKSLSIGGRGEDHYFGEEATWDEERPEEEIIPDELNTLTVWKGEAKTNVTSTNSASGKKQRTEEREQSIEAIQKDLAKISADVVAAHRAYRKAGYPSQKLRTKEDNDGLSPHARSLKDKYWALKEEEKALKQELKHMRSILLEK